MQELSSIVGEVLQDHCGTLARHQGNIYKWLVTKILQASEGRYSNEQVQAELSKALG